MDPCVPSAQQPTRLRRASTLFAFVALIVCNTGFVCASRVERLEQQVLALEAQQQEMQRISNKRSTELVDLVLRAEQAATDLKEQITIINKQSKGTVIELSGTVDRLSDDLRKLRGEVERVNQDVLSTQALVQDIAGSLNFGSSGTAVKLPEGADALLTFADDKLKAKEFAAAEVAYKAFGSRYKDDKRIDQAILGEGKALIGLKQHNRARQVLQGVLRLKNTSKLAPEAVYLIGTSSITLGDCKNARTFLNTLAKQKSSFSADAKARLKDIQDGNVSCKN